jgi:hypothetical protein
MLLVLLWDGATCLQLGKHCQRLANLGNRINLRGRVARQRGHDKEPDQERMPLHRRRFAVVNKEPRVPDDQCPAAAIGECG